MSRPKPEIILENTNPKNYKSEQVLKADAIYSVFYKGKPINYQGKLLTTGSIINEFPKIIIYYLRFYACILI